MERTIPQFSAKEINEVDDYERFRNTRAYLRQKSGRRSVFNQTTVIVVVIAGVHGI